MSGSNPAANFAPADPSRIAVVICIGNPDTTNAAADQRATMTAFLMEGGTQIPVCAVNVNDPTKTMSVDTHPGIVTGELRFNSIGGAFSTIGITLVSLTDNLNALEDDRSP